MTTNDCLKKIHSALVSKAKESCATSGNNQLALEISGKIADYGAYWATAFGNDGRITDDEECILCDKFNAILDGYVPSKEGALVEKAWSGIKYFGISFFKGIRAYINEWFGLSLD